MQLTKEQKFLQDVVNRAWEDDNFRQELIANPADSIRSVTGEDFPLPAGKELKVVDQTDPSYAYLNIPAKPDLDSMELTDEQLEMVAGGDVISALIIVGTATVISGIVSYTVADGENK